MVVRSFTGRTIPEALAKVRTHLGDAALIIETRPLKEPGMFGRNCGYEVVAAMDGHDDEPHQQQTIAQGVTMSAVGSERSSRGEDRVSRGDDRASRGDEHQPRDYDRSDHEDVRPRRWTTPLPVSAEATSSTGSNPAIDAELAAIRRQLTRLAAGQGTPTGHLGEDLARDLEDRELPAELIAELDEAVGRAGVRLEADKRRDFCAQILARGLDRVRPLDWSEHRRLLVVGPTGVGKTTTIAKLAGELVLQRQRRVALITIDTYRVGATDQLKAYADLLDIPLEIAATPAQLAESLRRFSEVDHVLIDTAGRSPADAARVHELKGFCRCAPGISVMLAAAATAGRAEFAAVVERFSILPVELAAITKLDECAAPGRLYGCLRRHRLPAAVVTTGQEVPADVAVADGLELARRVLAPRSASAMVSHMAAVTN